MPELARRRVVVGSLYAVLLVAAVFGSVAAGLDLWVPLLLAAAPWGFVLAARFGRWAALGLITLALLGTVLVTMVLTAALNVPLVLAFSVLSVLVGGAGALLTILRGWRPSFGRQPLTVLGVASGAVIWIAVVVVSRVLPGGGAYGWVMEGDSANNVLFARTDLALAGIHLGSGENPVPLPAAMMALAMSAGRGTVPSGALLAHDLTAFVGVWTGTIALLCILAGTTFASLVPAERSLTRAAVGALGSVFPLTWLVVGYPIEYGFFNIHVALLVVFASWSVLRIAVARPALAWSALTLACTLLLTVWSPLVLLSGGLLLVILIRSGRALWAAPVPDRVLALVGTAQLLVFGIAVTVPTLFAQAVFLSGGGAAYPFGKALFLVMGAAAVVVWAVTRRRIPGFAPTGFLALLAGAAVAYGALVFAARGAPSPLSSYYPSKLQWVVMILIFVIGGSLLIGDLMRRIRSRVVTVLLIAAIAIGTVAFAQLSPNNTTGYVRAQPLSSILEGRLMGPHDELAREILRYTDLEAPTILWKSQQFNEGSVDFWVLQMQAKTVGGNIPLRKIAYGAYQVNNVNDLCRIARLAGAPLRVITRDAALSESVASACPTEHIDVVKTAN